MGASESRPEQATAAPQIESKPEHATVVPQSGGGRTLQAVESFVRKQSVAERRYTLQRLTPVKFTVNSLECTFTAQAAWVGAKPGSSTAHLLKRAVAEQRELPEACLRLFVAGEENCLPDDEVVHSDCTYFLGMQDGKSPRASQTADVLNKPTPPCLAEIEITLAGCCVSRYNAQYFCKLTKFTVKLAAKEAHLEFDVHGDGSLGDLQAAEHSRLRMGDNASDWSTPALKARVHVSDGTLMTRGAEPRSPLSSQFPTAKPTRLETTVRTRNEIRGTLVYSLAAPSHQPWFAQFCERSQRRTPFGQGALRGEGTEGDPDRYLALDFEFGQSGYSKAGLKVRARAERGSS